MDTRPRWADLQDSSTEDLGALLGGGASSSSAAAAAAAAAANLLVARSFDSYIETPEWDLAENPHSSLNQQLRVMQCGPGAPSTGMQQQQQPTPQLQQLLLLQQQQHFPTLPTHSAGGGGLPAFGQTPPAALNTCWSGLNGARADGQASEFVPMMHAGVAPAVLGPVHTVTAALPLMMAAPVPPITLPCTMPSSACDSASHGPVRRRLAGKRPPTALWSSRKRPKQDHPGQEAAPLSPPLATPAAAGEKPPLPEASEEDWQRRQEKRQAAVDAVRASREYAAYVASKSRQDPAVPEIAQPDPLDRTISKRAWEEQVRQWRATLRQYFPDNGQDPSVE